MLIARDETQLRDLLGIIHWMIFFWASSGIHDVCCISVCIYKHTRVRRGWGGGGVYFINADALRLRRGFSDFFSTFIWFTNSRHFRLISQAILFQEDRVTNSILHISVLRGQKISSWCVVGNASSRTNATMPIHHMVHGDLSDRIQIEGGSDWLIWTLVCTK